MVNQLSPAARKEVEAIFERMFKDKLTFAQVESVTTDGVTLKFSTDGEETAKDYKFLQSYTPTAGDRVFVVRLSGSILVLGKK